MIDNLTFREIKQLQKQGHTFTYIVMALELEDDTVKAALQAKNYAEFIENSLQVL